MPKAKGFRYIIHTRCSLSSFPEWDKLRNENFKTIARFIHDVLLCQWGAIEIIISDNAPQYVQAIKYLAEKFNIKISEYHLTTQEHKDL